MDHGIRDMTAGTMHRPRWWQDARWIIAAIVTMTIVFLLCGLFGPEAAIRVSRETTYITEPLAADGLPDYRAALLAMAGPAPPPEENAAAAMLQVCWPMGIDDADLPHVCAALGIPNEPPPDPLRLPYDDAHSKVTSEMFDAAQERPWTGDDLPKLEAWLEKNETKIDQLVAASALPRYWLPSPTLLCGTEGPLISMELPDSFGMGKVKRILSCRAMWHGGEGRFVEAWRDIRALYRLSRLFMARERRPQLLILRLFAMRIEEAADDVMVQTVLADDGVPPELLAEICRELDRLDRSQISADFMPSERLFVIDFLVSRARRRLDGKAMQIDYLQGMSDRKMEMLLVTSLDWNDVLQCVNRSYDTIESALRLPEFALQQGALKAHRNTLLNDVTAWDGVSAIPMLSCNRGSRSILFARRMNLLVGTSYSSISIPEFRSRARFRLTRTAVALAEWRLDHRDEASMYPERLDDLVPRYLAAVPIDPFSDKPLIYERRGDGYLLASVGENGVFDGGDDMDGWIVNGEWQEDEQDVNRNKCDLVVRMPVPARSLTPPPLP